MRQDVLYARTMNGIDVPIVDVTNPAFRVTASDDELTALCDQFLRESQARQEVPPAVLEMLRRSTLGSALLAARGTFLAGMSTYFMKLGPDNLWDGAVDIDRRIAASFPALTNRIRLQDVSRLIADGIAQASDDPPRPLLVIDIAGGPAADSWNALLTLQAERPASVANRHIVIAVFDPDTEGPAFGAAAVARLTAASGPLHGLDISFRHSPLSWADAGALGDQVRALGAAGALCAASSEGGLFEYGTDTEIVACLAALRASLPADGFVVGTVTRDGEPYRASHRGSEVATKPRALETFGALAAEAGWHVERALERALSYHVRLVRR